MDENGANQGKLILELRVCFVVACLLYMHFSAIYEIVYVSNLESSGRFSARMKAKFGKI